MVNMFLKVLERSESEFTVTDDKTYTFSEKDLIKALERSYDEGMEWAFQLMEYDLKRLSKGGDEQ